MATIDNTGVTLEAFVAGDHTVDGTHANRLKVAWMWQNPDLLLADVAGDIESFLWKCLRNEVFAIEKRMQAEELIEIEIQSVS